MQFRRSRRTVALIFPREDVREVFIVAQCFAIGRLMFFAEMATARLVAGERVGAQQFGKLQEIGDASRPLQRLIELFALPRDTDPATAGPKLFAQLWNSIQRFG